MIGKLSRRHVIGASTGATLGLLLPTSSARGSGDRPIRLSLNENPFGPPESAKLAMRAAVDDAWSYTHDDAEKLRNLIAEREGLRSYNVMITAGSAEVLKIAGLVFGAGREAVAALPTFPMLTVYVVRNRGRVAWVDVDTDMRIDLTAMSSRIGAQTGIVYMCNPNNPTGTVVDPDKLRAFVQEATPRTTVLVDEAYIDFTEDPAASSVVDQVRDGRNLIVSRTFSKAYGIAGLRIGYGLGRPDLISRMEQRRVSVPNRMGLRAAISCLSDEDFLARTKELVRAGAERLYAFFDEAGVRYVPTQGNFVLFHANGPAVEFYRRMKNAGILIAPQPPPHEEWVRVSIGRPEEMESFTRAAQTFF
ncbi:MAG: histidinol-phosphate transaminase [Rhodospirillaceae bacterium]